MDLWQGFNFASNVFSWKQNRVIPSGGDFPSHCHTHTQPTHAKEEIDLVFLMLDLVPLTDWKS